MIKYIFVCFLCHRNVSQRELSRIERGKNAEHSATRRQPVPYRAMFRDPVSDLLMKINFLLTFRLDCR
jgi:hypothetical protein